MNRRQTSTYQYYNELSKLDVVSDLLVQPLRFFPYGMLKLANGKVSEKVKSESPIFGFKEHVNSQNGTSQPGNPWLGLTTYCSTLALKERTEKLIH